MTNVVITDVRFQNEINFIRENGGFVIRVKRGPEPEWYDAAFSDNTRNKSVSSMEKTYPNIHTSEWKWIGTPFDYELDNNGTLTELEVEIRHMLKIFRGPVQIAC